ncbi:MAG: T9SS type A sorting domain-containing protein, partial [Parvicellaceae bacterium]
CTSCSSPQTLFADNITPYAVDLSWNPGGSGGLIWNLEWGTSGFIQGNGNLINNLNNSYHTLTSLNPSTDYSFYVQEICGSNDQSSWSGPYNFTTNSLPPAPGNCGMFQIALYDTYGDGWQGGFAEIEVNYLVTQTITLQTGSGPEFFDIPVDSGDIVNVIYSPGAWEEENVYEVYDQNGLMIANEAGANGQGPADTYGLNACLPSGAGGNSSPCGWFILEMFDSLADGWNGSYITVELNGIATHNLTMLSGTVTQLLPFMVDSNQVIDVLYHDNGASSQEENSYKLTDNLGNLLSHEYGSLNNGPANTHGVIACESNLTAINDINSNVSIYPNPANNSFKVKSKNKIQQLTIYNIIGESVIDVYPQQKEFWLDVSFLSSNVYTVKVITENDQKIEKLLIHH